MKIGSRIVDAYLRTSVVGATQPAGKVSAPASAGSGPSEAARVSISDEARALMARASAPIDQAKVDTLRAKVADGSYTVDARMVAQRIVDQLA